MYAFDVDDLCYHSFGLRVYRVVRDELGGVHAFMGLLKADQTSASHACQERFVFFTRETDSSLILS